MGINGADVADLRRLAEQFDRAADQLESCRGLLTAQIRVSAWAGPVAVRFRTEWDTAHSGRVTDAAGALRDAGRRLRTNADDQERASAAANVGGGIHAGRGLDALVSSVPPDSVRLLGQLMATHDLLIDNVQDLIDLIREGELPGGVNAWEWINVIATGASMIDVKVPGLSELNLGMDAFSWANEVRGGTFDWYDAADVTSTVLKAAPNPVAQLIGINVAIWSDVVQEASRADFSSEGLESVGRYVVENPGETIEVIGESVIEVGKRAVGWLF